MTTYLTRTLSFILFTFILFTLTLPSFSSIVQAQKHVAVAVSEHRNNTNIPSKPLKQDIVTALESVNFAQCASIDTQFKGRGEVRVRVKIIAVSSGEITLAQVINDPYKNSALGKCLEQEVKRQKFPRFRRSSIKFTYPFTYSL